MKFGRGVGEESEDGKTPILQCCQSAQNVSNGSVSDSIRARENGFGVAYVWSPQTLKSVEPPHPPQLKSRGTNVQNSTIGFSDHFLFTTFVTDRLLFPRVFFSICSCLFFLCPAFEGFSFHGFKI